MLYRKYRGGRVYFPPSTAAYGALTTVADRLYVTPFDVGPDTLVPDQVGINVTTAMTVGTGGLPQVRLGIYEDDDGLPGRLIFDSGVIAGLNTTGAKAVDIPLTPSGNRAMSLTPGLYWLASLFATAGTGGAQAGVAALASGPQHTPLVGAASMANLPNSAATTATGFLIATQPFASGLPQQFPVAAGAYQLNAGFPLVGVRHAGF